MPYDSNEELPEQVKSVLPTKARTIFRKAYNSAYSGTCATSGNKEECSNKIAWAAVKNAGYSKGGNNMWNLSDTQETAEGFRELRAEVPRTYELVGEGLVVRGVKLLASGEWTDSLQRKALFYPESTLKKYADNWIDTAIWARHTGGMPRSIADKIGDVQNQRYENGAVVGDIFLHGKTQVSRDTIDLIKYHFESNNPIYVSVEHGGTKTYDSKNKRYEADSLVFGGLAVVNRGACAVCTINNEAPEGETMENSELEAKVQELETDVNGKADIIKELSEKLQASETNYSELKEKFDGMVSGAGDLENKISELEQKIGKLEQTPVTQTSAAAEPEKELAEPHLRVIVDKHSGEVYRK